MSVKSDFLSMFPNVSRRHIQDCAYLGDMVGKSASLEEWVETHQSVVGARLLVEGWSELTAGDHLLVYSPETLSQLPKEWSRSKILKILNSFDAYMLIPSNSLGKYLEKFSGSLRLLGHCNKLSSR